jgi:diguanylate cyclase (GGDEF)-like protein/PAS domain S-box-containing protein
VTVKRDSRESARLKMSELMLNRLPLCIGVAAIFGSVLVYVWQQMLTSWQFLSWCGYLIIVSIANLALVKRYSPTDIDEEITESQAADIDRLTMIVAVATGMAWFLASVIQYNNPVPNSWLYLSILVCVAASSGILFCYNIKAALTVVSMTLVPCFMEIFRADKDMATYFVASVLIYFSTLYVVLIQLHNLLKQNLELRFTSESAIQQQAQSSYLFEQHWLKAPFAAIQWDRNQNIIDWNPRAEELFGYTKEEVLGKHSSFLSPIEANKQAKKMWSALYRRQKDGYHSVHGVKHKSDDVLTCEWHNTPLLKDGKLIGAASFVEDITSQVEAEETIKRQASYDNLTGLPNRRRMMEELERAISRSQRTRQYAAVLFLDLDHFKDINDTQGHHVGDLVLKHFANIVREAVRGEDVVARFGGDEFVILVEDLGWQDNEARNKVLSIADKILDMGNNVDIIEGVEYDLEVSGGIVLFSNGQWTSHDILKQADLAMYRVKTSGRKGFCFYDESMAIDAEYRVAMIRELRQGLKKSEFDLHFQPIVNGAGKVFSAESLLRWNRPMQRIAHAGEFIDLMSSLPMMHEVGYWLLEKVCRNIVLWNDREDFPDDFVMFVNISPKQLQDERFAKEVIKIVDSFGVDPNLLVFEITEESLIHNLEKVRGQLDDLIAYGIRIALDDFGTGYSSLAMLQDLPVQYVKLDREFICNLDENDDSFSIVDAVVKLCEVLSLQVIAEGIENEQQYLTLKKMGCHYFQGYYFEKPMPEHEFVDMLSSEVTEKTPHLVVVGD